MVICWYKIKNSRWYIIKLVKITWNIYTWIIFIIAIVIAVLFVIPRAFKVYPYAVTSGSMEPKYKVNSIIYVKKTSPDNIKVGDSITFHLSEDLIATHEVYKIDKIKKLFYTRGINNKDENGTIINPKTSDNFKLYLYIGIMIVSVLGVIITFIYNKKQPV